MYKRNQRGIALIMVLGMLAVATVMTAHLAATSTVTGRAAKVAALHSRLLYEAESAAERAYWLWLADRRAYPRDHVNLAMPPSERESGAGDAVWRADGRQHELQRDDSRLQVRLLDADRGLDVSGKQAARQIRNELLAGVNEEDIERQDRIDTFADILGDYVDADDFVRLRGMEVDDYLTEGVSYLPRNGPLQFREEVLWLPEAAVVLGRGQAENFQLETLRLVPPEGRKFPGRNKPSFFSSSPGFIAATANLNQAELRAVWRARDRSLNEGVPLIEALEPALYSRLMGKFSLKESGVVTVVVTAASKDGLVRRVLHTTRENRPAIVRDGKDIARVSNWQRILF